MKQRRQLLIGGVGLLFLGFAATVRGQVTGNSAPSLTVIAGDGTKAPTGASCIFNQSSAAIFASLNTPTAVAVDTAGNKYVAVGGLNCVIQVDANGIVPAHHNIGTGVQGFSDNLAQVQGGFGDASGAQLWAPTGVAVDPSGNVYIADQTNSRIRKVDAAAWTISTVAGGGSSRAFDGQLATNVALLFPQGVAADHVGNFYFSDNTRRVYKVDSNGILTHIAGTGGSSYDGSEGTPAVNANMIPLGLAVDQPGNVYIADWANNIIRKVDTSGNISTVAGNPFNVTGLGDGNPAEFGATLNQPRGVAVDANGNIFIADTSNHRIRKVDGSGIISTVAGDGTPGGALYQLNFPNGVAVDQVGNIYIADTVNQQARALMVAAPTHALTLSTAGSGTGVVSGAGTYTSGLIATVAATASPGSIFAGWTGPNAGECSSGAVLMDADKSCTATFSLCATNLSGFIGVTRSGFAYNFTRQSFFQTVTLTNNSSTAIAGPISLALDSLSGNASLSNASGIASCNLPASSFINSSVASLAPGASTSIVLQFADPSRAAITYNTRVLAGPGIR